MYYSQNWSRVLPQFKALLRDYTTFFKKESDNFRGVKNTYEPRPDTVDLPSERKLIAVVTTVDEKFDYGKKLYQ